MANNPILKATVKVTAKDLLGNNIAKQFNNVIYMNFDYNDGTVNIQDVTGSFYFPLTPMTTLTYTIVAGIAGSHVVVMS